MCRWLSNYFRVTKVWPVGSTGKKVTKINRFPPTGSRKAHSKYCVFYEQRLRRYCIESFENWKVGLIWCQQKKGHGVTKTDSFFSPHGILSVRSKLHANQVNNDGKFYFGVTDKQMNGQMIISILTELIRTMEHEKALWGIIMWNVK